MRPGNTNERLILRRFSAAWAVSFALSLSLLFPTGSARSASPGEFYREGNDCAVNLYASSPLRTKRAEWERCMKPLERLTGAFPASSEATDALLLLGDLYWGLHGYTSADKDREIATDYYRQFLERAPRSKVPGHVPARLGVSSSAAAGSAPASPADAVVAPKADHQILDLRSWTYPQFTRLVLDLSGPALFTTETASHGKSFRVVLPSTILSPEAALKLPFTQGKLKSISMDGTGPNLEIRIALGKEDESPKILPLPGPDRLVIDLFHNEADRIPMATNPPSSITRKAEAAPNSTRPAIRTIVIDAGHGGKDPGAIGRSGLTEKEVVLDVALRLRKLIERKLNRTVLMTRESDVFVSLDDRTLLANSSGADLFVSIHVNAHPRRDTRGVEIYLLGRSTDKAALETAARENAVTLEAMGSLEASVKQILFDLGRDYNTDQSLELAHNVRDSFLSTIRKDYRYNIPDHGVKRAPFYVLMNSNMPSILAEVSFISNSEEERLLKRSDYRQAVAESLFNGISRYIKSLETAS